MACDVHLVHVMALLLRVLLLPLRSVFLATVLLALLVALRPFVDNPTEAATLVVLVLSGERVLVRVARLPTRELLVLKMPVDFDFERELVVEAVHREVLLLRGHELQG